MKNRAVLFDSFSCRRGYYPLLLHIFSGTFFAFCTLLSIWGFYFYFHILLTHSVLLCYSLEVSIVYIHFCNHKIIELCVGRDLYRLSNPPPLQWAVTFSSRSCWDLCSDLRCLLVLRKEEGAHYLWWSHSIRAARDDSFMFHFERIGTETRGLFQKSFIKWM